MLKSLIFQENLQRILGKFKTSSIIAETPWDMPVLNGLRLQATFVTSIVVDIAYTIPGVEEPEVTDKFEASSTVATQFATC